MSQKFFLSAVIALSLGITPAMAEVLILKNGDRISGEVVEKTDTKIHLRSTQLGDIMIDAAMVDKTMTDIEAMDALSQSAESVQSKYEAELARLKADAEAARAEAEAAKSAAAPTPAPAAAKEPVVTKPKYWNTKLSAGYMTTNGNTKNSHANIGLDATYKKEAVEWGVKGQMEYGSDKGKMNVQKYYVKAKSDSRLGESKRWFNSRSVEVSHDRFSNIDYRVLPAFGFGYWFFEGDNSKFETDLGLGYEYTNYADSSKATGNLTAIPHLYYDRVLIGKLKFAEDFTFYPSLENGSDYRFRSESSLVNPLSDVLSWKVSFVDDFNSNPKGTAKKNDTSLITAIEYAF